MIRIIDNLMVWLPIILIAIALLLACALRIVCRGAASSSSPSAVADDPFFFPFGEMPIVPRERHIVARDFRAWGVPRFHSGGFVKSEPGPLVGERCESFPLTARQYERLISAAVAHRRNESGGRPVSLSGTAVVLTLPQRRA